MVDLGPAPHFRVDWDIVREANGMARQTSTGTTPGYGTEAESLLALSRAVGGRIAALRFATCNMARGTGPTFLAALAGVLQMNGKPTLYGLDGFLWSDEEEGRTVMGVTSTRGSRPLRVYHSTMWTGHWYPQRRSQVGP